MSQLKKTCVSFPLARGVISLAVVLRGQDELGSCSKDNEQLWGKEETLLGPLCTFFGCDFSPRIGIDGHWVPSIPPIISEVFVCSSVGWAADVRADCNNHLDLPSSPRLVCLRDPSRMMSEKR